MVKLRQHCSGLKRERERERVYNVPNAMGALNVKPVAIRYPRKSLRAFFNYK